MKAAEASIKEAIAGGKLQEKNGTDTFEIELDNNDVANQMDDFVGVPHLQYF